jgi:hypothetical protein
MRTAYVSASVYGSGIGRAMGLAQAVNRGTKESKEEIRTTS